MAEWGGEDKLFGKKVLLLVEYHELLFGEVVGIVNVWGGGGGVKLYGNTSALKHPITGAVI